MQFSAQWLQQWVGHGLSLEDLSAKLTMAGLEVEQLTPVNQCDPRVVVGQVRSRRPHESSSKLQICEVTVGSDEVVQVVCGADNVRTNMKSAVALAGSVVGDGRSVKPTTIQGVESSGMLCSEAELGIGDIADVIVEFHADAPVGISVNEYLQLNDSIFDLSLTPNRSDCISVIGVAREVAIISGQPMKEQLEAAVPAQSNNTMPIDIQAPAACPRYVGRVIENIRLEAVTPDWMKQRLQRSNLRCIHPIVDITNYVMLELGQPMHAFDMDLLDPAEIVVRLSKDGEKLTLLDGEELDLKDGSLLIADPDKPIGLAGVKGGISSAISSSSKNVFLEAAFFSPLTIRHSVARFGLHTDASHRFESGVDPFLQVKAMARATELILQVAGGTPAPLQNISNEEYISQKFRCKVRASRVERVLGIKLSGDEIHSILEQVNKDVSKVEGGWSVLPPSYRFDLDAEHDQIEEIARISGYDSIPSSVRFGQTRPSRIAESVVKESTIRHCMEQSGYFEAITYSFVDPRLQNKIRPSIQAKPLANPIASNMSVMRTSIWPGLVQAYCENYRRLQKSVRLYEIGRIFHPDGEHNMLSGIASGSYVADHWGVSERSIDFYDIKNDISKLFDLAGIIDSVEFRTETCDGLHPGCSSVINLVDQKIGVAGQLHPDVLREDGIEESIYVFEISLDSISERPVSEYSTVSKFPPIMRDISIVIDNDVQAGRVSEVIIDTAGDSLETLKLFDVYSGVGIDSNRKSLAYRLQFRLKSRTLTDSEVDLKINEIVNCLQTKLKVQLRT